MDDSKFYAVMMMLAEHCPQTPAQKALRERALEKLAEAVLLESDARARCRDTDVAAATRVRAW